MSRVKCRKWRSAMELNHENRIAYLIYRQVVTNPALIAEVGRFKACILVAEALPQQRVEMRVIKLAANHLRNELEPEGYSSTFKRSKNGNL